MEKLELVQSLRYLHEATQKFENGWLFKGDDFTEVL